MDGEPDRNLLCFLVQSFVNGISNEYHQHLIKVTMPTDIYTYEEAKTTAKKVIITTSNIPQPVTAPTPTRISASVQPVEPGNEISDLAKAVQELNKRLNNLEKLQPSSYTYNANTHQQVLWGDVVCFNCIEPGHTAKNCTLQPISWNQAQANREEVRRRQEERQQN